MNDPLGIGIIKMLGAALSVFSKPDEFQASMRESADVDLTVTSTGRFLARVTRIQLSRMRLLTCDEHASRIAFITVPLNMVRVTLPPKPDNSLMWDGKGARPHEIVTHNAGHRFHERTGGPCRWSSIFFPARDFVNAGRVSQGTSFKLPPGECRWLPAAATLRSLVRLHDDAIRATASRPRLPVGKDAARGLEEQLTLALTECLEGKDIDPAGSSEHPKDDIMIRFEDMLRAVSPASLSVADMAKALGVSVVVLRRHCHRSLGMAPGRYIFLRRMGQVLQALHSADPTLETVARIAQVQGFGRSGRFAAAYRSMFGELPSVTLRRVRFR
jgi:AraC-like DNA-binding protein